jgi:hypothetical protein
VQEKRKGKRREDRDRLVRCYKEKRLRREIKEDKNR